MKWLTLDWIKKHSRIDYDCEDDVLEEYGEDAEDTVLNIINRTYDELISTYGAVPKPLFVAALMLVEVSYNHRSPVTQQQLYIVPDAFDMKLKPYMRLTSDVDTVDVQTVTLGSDVKIAFTADLPDELILKDVDFSVMVYNNMQVGKQKTYEKSDCVMMEGGAEYVALVDTEFLGIGTYLLKLTVQIPDTDYQSGFRKEVVKINPHVQVKG